MNIDVIVSKLGGPVAVGRACGVTRQAVCQWSEIPSRFVLTLANADVTPHQMRPDLYPHPLDGRRARRRANGKLRPA